MISAFYSGVSGAKSAQAGLDVNANNIANVNTTGYKAQQTGFSDLLYIETSAQNPVQIGSGVKVSAVSSFLDTGSIQQTGAEYDFAILGEGYFCVRGNDNNIYYTRNGNFNLQEQDGTTYLVTASGEQVLNSQQSPVTLSAASDSESAEASETATVGIDIGVFTFNNPYALTRNGYGLFSANAQSGAAEVDAESYVVQGAIEGSNVDLTCELTDMMQAQRSFQMSVKLIQTADELENIANNLR